MCGSLEAKPAATVMQGILADNEKQVLQAVQSAVQAQPGPHHLSYLLAYCPPDATELR